MAVTKLEKIDREVTVTICDNGFLVGANGRDSNDNWASTKNICETLEDVKDLLVELCSLPIND